jgi:hypothetical protein
MWWPRPRITCKLFANLHHSQRRHRDTGQLLKQAFTARMDPYSEAPAEGSRTRGSSFIHRSSAGAVNTPPPDKDGSGHHSGSASRCTALSSAYLPECRSNDNNVAPKTLTQPCAVLFHDRNGSKLLASFSQVTHLLPAMYT